jgi:hypothetical protein
MPPPGFSPPPHRSAHGSPSSPTTEVPSGHQQRPRNSGTTRSHRPTASEPTNFDASAFLDGRALRHSPHELAQDVDLGPSNRSSRARLGHWLCKLLRNGNGSSSSSMPVSSAGRSSHSGHSAGHSRNLDLLAEVAEVDGRPCPREGRYECEEGEGAFRARREHQRSGKRRHDTSDARMDSDRRERPSQRK